MNFKTDTNCSYIEKQIKSLEKLTDEDRPFTRLVFSKKFYEARSWLSEQFNVLGLSISTDEAGNLIGLLKSTARELHIYVKQNVVQQSSGSQTPELQGDKERVLVQFN